MAQTEEEKLPLWRSLRVQLLLTNLVVLLVTVVLLNIYPPIVSQDLVLQEKYSSLRGQVSVIASPLASLNTLTAEGAEQVMTQLGSVNATRVLITDASALILYDTAGMSGKSALFPEVEDALNGNLSFYSSYHGGVFYSYVATPVYYRNTVIGCVYLYEEDAQQGALIGSIQSNLMTVSLVISIITILISVFFSTALMRRIDRLLKAIRTVRDGGYNHRIPVTGRDEVTRLAENFNELTDRLESTEQVRQQFVSDASHELKTPLASIRLLSDSILHTEMDMQTAREFVNDIGSEADRLTRITERLLTLTKVDSDVPVVCAPVSLVAVLEKIGTILYPLADARGIHIELNCSGANGIVYANADDTHQILFNLVENAVKYNVDYGQVWVTLREQADTVTVTVEDSGVGIPTDDAEKVFDRFYRVDKARSRAAGGTGLGLSIAQDLAHKHGGKIQVSAREGGGSCFTLTLPKWSEEGEV